MNQNAAFLTSKGHFYAHNYHRRWRTVNMYAGFCDMSAGNAEVPLSIDKESCIIKTKDQVPLSCQL